MACTATVSVATAAATTSGPAGLVQGVRQAWNHERKEREARRDCQL